MTQLVLHCATDQIPSNTYLRCSSSIYDGRQTKSSTMCYCRRPMFWLSTYSFVFLIDVYSFTIRMHNVNSLRLCDTLNVSYRERRETIKNRLGIDTIVSWYINVPRVKSHELVIIYNNGRRLFLNWLSNKDLRVEQKQKYLTWIYFISYLKKKNVM